MTQTRAAPPTGSREKSGTHWWGPFSVEQDRSLRWRIGPMRLWIGRTDREWRVSCERGDDPFEPTLAVAEPATDGELPGPDALRQRFGFRRTTDSFHVLPALADRSLVVKPEEPFHLPSGEAITLFISVPLWVGLHVGDPPVRLFEAPVYRPSDTWFGPPTVHGGCCYASRTRARASWDDLTLLPHRAVSVVSVRNDAETQLALERLRLPLPNLSLFASGEGNLWTEAVTLERKEDGESASLDLGEGPPEELGAAELVAGPRERPEKGMLMRAFGGLL